MSKYLTKQRAEVADMILTDFDQDAYEEMLKEEALKRGRTEGIQEGLRTGLERGKAEGLKTGHERGRAEGLKEGKAEALQSMAANMRRQGETEEKILAYTGLTKEQLKALEE